jgi:hypothetical protein
MKWCVWSLIWPQQAVAVFRSWHHSAVEAYPPHAVDTELNSCCCCCRPIGTNSGYLTAKLPIPVKPTGRVVELSPQTSSLSFNEQGQVGRATAGCWPAA